MSTLNITDKEGSTEEVNFKCGFSFSQFGVIVLLLKDDSTLLLYPSVGAYQKGNVPKDEILEELQETNEEEIFRPFDTSYVKLGSLEMRYFVDRKWFPLH